MAQDLQSQTYLVIFILAGLVWVGLDILLVLGWYLFMHKPTPKPTRWEAEWKEIERDMNR